ncbi:MAG: hypothetical protein HY822_16020 [Acidobacteria bacterium]|nr:hypothetical protein [Acidobacteriota bacterium]
MSRTLRVLVAGNTLYFGFECTDPEPARIAIHTMQRDASLEGDDNLSVVLGTSGDGRTGFYFQINAAGARADGLISDPEHVSLDWDGIWDARVHRGERFWSAEIEIPARTLSFRPGLGAWSLNLQRWVARERMALRWSSPRLDAFLFDLSRAGSLTGIGNLDQGRGLELTPYAAGRTREIFGASPRSWQGALGADATWRITPQVAAVFTANTDFAETEADSRQINITRFPLFFPEKRAFFMEGANQFDFGLNLGRTFSPFFTRRIGLLEGRQVPLEGGVKLSGRAGRWNLALLDVETRATSFAPRTNLFAGRASYDVDQHLRVGAILTHGDPTGRTRNTLAGFDAVWRTSAFRGNKNLLLSGWGAFAAGEAGPGQSHGWGYKVDYPNDLWDCASTFNEFGEALDPKLGFLPRPGVRRYGAKCDFTPRPSRDGPWNWSRQWFFEGDYSRVDNLRGGNESWQFALKPAGVEFRSGDKIEFEWTPQYEFLPVAFEITDGVRIRPGAYRFNRYALGGETSRHRSIRTASSTTFGTFYSGRLVQWQNAVSWTAPRGRFQTGLSVEQNFGRLREASFVQRLWQLQAAYAWNPNLTLASFLQYDSESGNLGANTRLRWTIKPGREFFVVWNRGWQRLLTSRDDLLLKPDSEMFAVKLRWTFRP